MQEVEQEEKQSFDGNLDFNAWQLTPAYDKRYSDIINKDAPLSNIGSKTEMDYIDYHLRTAAYLNGITQKKLVGYEFWCADTNGEESSIYLEVDSYSEGLSIIGDKKVLGIRKVYREEQIMKKSTHNKLSRAYTRMSLSRGIKGQAAKDLKTIRHEEHKTLNELTERGGFSLFKKKSSNWGEYEKQKNY